MSTNDITGARLVTPAASKEYLENYDLIFGQKKKCVTEQCGCEHRCIEYEQEYEEYLDATTEKCKP